MEILRNKRSKQNKKFKTKKQQNSFKKRRSFLYIRYLYHLSKMKYTENKIVKRRLRGWGIEEEGKIRFSSFEKKRKLKN